MARLFGALANAAAKYGEGRFKRKTYDDQQAQQALENQRRAFEFAATNGRLEEQMKMMREFRDEQLRRQREMDVIAAQQKNYESGPQEGAVAIGAAANAFLGSQGMGGPATAGMVRPPVTAPVEFEAEGAKFGDAKQTPRPRQYATVGGRLMSYDPQRQENDASRRAFEKFVADLAGRRAIEADKAEDREALQRIANSGRQPRAPRTQLVQNENGEYVIVDLDQLGPTGLNAPKKAAAGAKVSSSDRKRLLDVQDIMRAATDAKMATDGVEGFAGPIDVPMQRFKTMLGRPDAKVTDAMRKYQRLASPAARQTIGTAMTPQEIKRLEYWLPMLDSSDEDVIREGIAGFEKEARAIWRENLDVMRASGMDVSEFESLPGKWSGGDESKLPPWERKPQ